MSVTYKNPLKVQEEKNFVANAFKAAKKKYQVVKQVTDALEKYDGKSFTRRVTNSVAKELGLRILYTDQHLLQQIVVLQPNQNNIILYIKDVIEDGKWDHQKFVSTCFDSYKNLYDRSCRTQKALPEISVLVKRYNDILKQAQKLVADAEKLHLPSSHFDI